MDKIYISYLLDMSDAEATNWLIENESDYVLVKKTDLRSNAFEAAKQTAFKIGGGIREDSRINKLSQEFAVAIVLNHLSDLTEEYEET